VVRLLKCEIDYSICKRVGCEKLLCDIVCSLAEDLYFLGKWKGGIPKKCPFITEQVILGKKSGKNKSKKRNM
jgi:hypothetical protein